MILTLFITGILACSNNLASFLANDITEEFLNYLRWLQNESVKGFDLDFLTSRSSEGILMNPINESLIYIDPEVLVHYERINAFLKEQLDLEKVKEFVLTTKRNTMSFVITKEDTVNKTTDVRISLKFNEIPPGKIRGHLGTIKLTNYIKASATPITESMWVDLMYKEYDKGRFETDDRFSFESDNFVDVYWFSALDFANKLSIKNNLRPVYNLDAIKKRLEGSHRNGYVKLGLNAIYGQDVEYNKELKKFKSFFKKVIPAKYYEEEGFRLPTMAERHYLNEIFGYKFNQGTEWTVDANIKWSIMDHINPFGRVNPIRYMPNGHWIRHQNKDEKSYYDVDFDNIFVPEIAVYPNNDYILGKFSAGAPVVYTDIHYGKQQAHSFRLVRTIKKP